ncbi:MAG: cytochrome c family protein [Rhodobacter sp.]|nr:cytochrome c family protein [Rhodobacter sp.]
MFDTMTMTKIVGGFCGMFLIFLLGNWAAESIYHVGEAGHGDEHHQAYTIDTGAGDAHGGTETDAPAVDFGVVLASADVAAGEKLFKACKSCHKIEAGANGTGPSLYGVVGRPVGSADGFKYSGNLVKVAQTWTPEALQEFLTNPKAYAPGTKMTYKGMADIEDRANLIAWLDSLDN